MGARDLEIGRLWASKKPDSLGCSHQGQTPTTDQLSDGKLCPKQAFDLPRFQGAWGSRGHWTIKARFPAHVSQMDQQISQICTLWKVSDVGMRFGEHILICLWSWEEHGAQEFPTKSQRIPNLSMPFRSFWINAGPRGQKEIPRFLRTSA